MADPAYAAITKARNQESNGNFAGAAETLENYLATDPHCTSPRLELARVYQYGLKDTKTAVMQIDVVLDLEPDNIDALKIATSIKTSDKTKIDECEEEFEHLGHLLAGRNDPAEFAQVAGLYAVFLRKQKTDFERSAEWYRKAIAADPDNYTYHQNYAVLLLNDIKDYQAAKEELETVMRLRPGSEEAKRNYDLLMRRKFDKNGNLKKGLMDRIRRR